MGQGEQALRVTVTKMTKRWTIHPHNPKPPKAKPLEDKLARYGLNPTPAQRRRLSGAAERAVARAMTLRGAARNSAMRKLGAMKLSGLVSDRTFLLLSDPRWASKRKFKGSPLDIVPDQSL